MKQNNSTDLLPFQGLKTMVKMDQQTRKQKIDFDACSMPAHPAQHHRPRGELTTVLQSTEIASNRKIHFMHDNTCHASVAFRDDAREIESVKIGSD